MHNINFAHFNDRIAKDIQYGKQSAIDDLKVLKFNA